jgi:hypothetical protein
MRKTLIALATLAGVISASYLAIGTPAPLITGASGCQEASQLLNCLNSQVINLLRGAGQLAPISVGSFGTGADNAANTVTLNTQGGVVTFTGLTVAQNGATGSVAINNTLVNTSSFCLATIVSDTSAAGSSPYIDKVAPGAGNLTFSIRNAAINTSTGAFNIGVGYWCAN